MPNGIFLVGKVNEQVSVIRQCLKAQKLGLKTGSALNLSLAFLPHAVIKDFNPEADFKDLYKLCCWTDCFTPIHGLDAEIVAAYKQKSLWKINPYYYGLNLDITGTERVNKGELSLIKHINSRMIKARFEARVAIASTLGAAWALSRFSNQKIFISNTSIKEDIANLPVESLRIRPNIVSKLNEVGIRTITSLLDLPRKAILERYGYETLRQIDRVCGDEPEPVTPVPMPDKWSAHREFDYPINELESIVEIVLLMLEELVKVLSSKNKKTKYFLLTLQGEDLWGSPFRTRNEFSLFESSTNTSHIKAVLFPLLEKLSLPGPVYILILSTKNASNIESTQLDLDKSNIRQASANELINQLATEVGASNIKEVRFSNSFLPEESFSYSPLGQSDPESLSESKLRVRPTQLLQVPLEISAIAMLPDNPPVQVTLESKPLKILKGIGPERITHPWLKSGDFKSRDYYKVEDENGRWLWIYRDTVTLKWFLHGVWY